MEPYKPNKPWLSVNLPTREELIAMAMGLIPGGRALKYYHDNPEGPISETLDLAAEDLVPFYANLIKPAVKGEDINLRNNLIEAALIGLPLNGPRGVKRTDPKRVPIDEARTAEFRQKLDELNRNPELSANDKLFVNKLLEDDWYPGLGLPTTSNMERNGNILGQILDRHGLGDYYDDLVFRRNAMHSNPEFFINPEEYAYRRADNHNLDRAYNYLNDEYGHDYLFRNRDNEITFDQAKDWYEGAANRRNVDKPFGDFIVDYYDKQEITPRAKYLDAYEYEFTPNRMKDIMNNSTPNLTQEMFEDYLNRTIKPTSQWQEKVIDILKSDLPKEEKRALIKDIYGDVVLPIEIEELLL